MNLLYGNGEVVLEENTEVVGLQIHFMGKINVVSKLPDNFNVILADGKILIYSLELSVLPEMLFTYNGAFRITQCIASTDQGEKVNVFPSNNNLGFWSKTNSTYDTGSEWENYSGGYRYGAKVYIQKNNIPKVEKGTKVVKRESVARNVSRQTTRSSGGY